MPGSLYLTIEPLSISPAEWTQVVDKTITLLERWTPSLCSWTTYTYHQARLTVITSTIYCPHQRRWQILARHDPQTLGDRYLVYRDLAWYQSRSSHHVPIKDLIRHAAKHRINGFGNSVHHLPSPIIQCSPFNHPHHLALLAVAMVIEKHFPNHAMTFGNIHPSEISYAQKRAEEILNQPVPVPTRMDPRRLLTRIQPVVSPTELLECFRALVCVRYEHDKHQVCLQFLPHPIAISDWFNHLRRRTPPPYLLVQLVSAWINAGKDLHTCGYFSCILPDGPRLSPLRWIDSVVDSGLLLSNEIKHKYHQILNKLAPDIETLAHDERPSSPFGLLTTQHMRIQTFITYLSNLFPDQILDLIPHLHRQVQKLERDVLQDIRELSPKTQLQADECSSLHLICHLHSRSQLNSAQVLALEELIRHTQEQIYLLRDHIDIMTRFCSLSQVRDILLHMLSILGPYLRKEVVESLTQERRRDVLLWLLGLVRTRVSTPLMLKLKISLFESPQLLDESMRWGHTFNTRQGYRSNSYILDSRGLGHQSSPRPHQTTKKQS
ncbi:MAG: hypothetical protein KTR25_13175 [Myxococcales bacterium]|nr:hypothetical protein [Myxococcales bacterium]